MLILFDLIIELTGIMWFFSEKLRDLCTSKFITTLFIKDKSCNESDCHSIYKSGNFYAALKKCAWESGVQYLGDLGIPKAWENINGKVYNSLCKYIRWLIYAWRRLIWLGQKVNYNCFMWCVGRCMSYLTGLVMGKHLGSIDI